MTEFFALSKEEFKGKYYPVDTHPKDIKHDNMTSYESHK